jgi:hypothetical protein
MKKDKQENYLFLLISALYLFSSMLVLFLSTNIYSLHELTLFQKSPFSDIVFDRNNNGASYAYYDSFNDLRAKHNESIINADIYIAPPVQDGKEDWFSFNWTLNEMPLLKENEIVVTKNIANRYGLKLNDLVHIGLNTFTVVDFLPTMKGFQILSGREGVMLISYHQALFNQAESFMYFNTNPRATFSNSQVIRSTTYLTINQSPSLILLSIYFLISFVYPVFLHLSSFLNPLKIRIWKSEGFKKMSMLKFLFYSTTMIPIIFGFLKLLLTTSLAYSSYHLTIIVPLLLSFLLTSMTALIYVFGYVFIKTNKRIIQ